MAVLNKAIVLCCALVATALGSVQSGEDEAASVYPHGPLHVKNTEVVKVAAPDEALHANDGGIVGHGPDEHGDHHHHHHHHDHHDHNCHQSYKFGYKIIDKYGNKQAREEEADEYNNRKGYYAFIDRHGLQRKVEYVADKHGFRARVHTNEPGTAKQHPAHVNMLANPVHVKVEHVHKGHAGYAAHGHPAAYGKYVVESSSHLDGPHPRGPATESAAQVVAVATSPTAPVAAVEASQGQTYSLPSHSAARPTHEVHTSSVAAVAAAPAPLIKVAHLAAPDAAHTRAPVVQTAVDVVPYDARRQTLFRAPAYASYADPLDVSPSAAAFATHSHPYTVHVPAGRHESAVGGYNAPVSYAGYAPVSYAGYAGAASHSGHAWQGVMHEASFAQPVTEYRTHPAPSTRMVFVTGGYRGRY